MDWRGRDTHISALFPLLLSWTFCLHLGLEGQDWDLGYGLFSFCNAVVGVVTPLRVVLDPLPGLGLVSPLLTTSLLVGCFLQGSREAVTPLSGTAVAPIYPSNA
jgi:hypothetical protein